MSQRVRRNRPVHPLRIVLLASALGLVVVGLSQCRLASDTITGVESPAGRLSGKSNCVLACNDTFEAGQRAEQDRWRDATRACGGDKACRDRAKVTHDQIEDQLQEAKKACKKGCYNEGGGSGA